MTCPDCKGTGSPCELCGAGPDDCRCRCEPGEPVPCPVCGDDDDDCECVDEMIEEVVSDG